jgi:phosphoribosyl-AMP cyclohydrolase
MSDANKGTAASAAETIEQTLSFRPAFDANGLIPAIVTDRKSGNVLMFAHMNDAALQATLKSGFAHFWSRSRSKLWKKGEESGNLLKVSEVRTDCDQDVLWIVADVEGDGVACHTGAPSCFYRRLVRTPDAAGGTLLERSGLPYPSVG